MPGDSEADVPLAAIPVPALRFEVREDEAVATHANAAFESAFGDISSETPIRRWLNTREMVRGENSIAAVCASLVAAESVAETVRIGDSRDRAYTLRSAGRSEASQIDAGVVTLTPVSSTSAGATDVDRVAQFVSHDLRNPLDVAKARLRAAREEGDDEHFDRAENAHERMEQILNDVLTLTRGEEAVTPSTTVELGAVATDAWASVDTGAASLTVDNDLSAVDADPGRLQRLFENLFRNAVEHGSTNPDSRARQDTVDDGSTSPRSQPSQEAVEHAPDDAERADIRVRVGSMSEGGFFVADDGRGIPEADHGIVFEPGYSSDENGAGLGLTIVDCIGAAHGWAASVSSSADGGARFEFHDEQSADD